MRYLEHSNCYLALLKKKSISCERAWGNANDPSVNFLHQIESRLFALLTFSLISSNEPAQVDGITQLRSWDNATIDEYQLVLTNINADKSSLLQCGQITAASLLRILYRTGSVL